MNHKVKKIFKSIFQQTSQRKQNYELLQKVITTGNIIWKQFKNKLK